MFLKLPEEQDREDCIRMAKNFFEASPFSNLKFSREGLDAFFNQYLVDKNSCIIILLCSNEGENVGMVCGIAQNPLFSSEQIASELAWWVDEEYRHNGKSAELMYAFEDWGKRIGAKASSLASIEGFSPPGVDKFYTKMGYHRSENSYYKEFN